MALDEEDVADADGMREEAMVGNRGGSCDRGPAGGGTSTAGSGNVVVPFAEHSTAGEQARRAVPQPRALGRGGRAAVGAPVTPSLPEREGRSSGTTEEALH